MPPEGYDTVTLPEALVEHIDDYVDDPEYPAHSRADAIARAFGDRLDTSSGVDAEQLDRIEGLAEEAANAAQRAEKGVEELRGGP